MHKQDSLEDLDLSRLMLLEEGHCLRDHALSVCPIGERKNDHRLKASSLPTFSGNGQFKLRLYTAS